MGLFSYISLRRLGRFWTKVKTYINGKIEDIDTFDQVVVDTLPETGEYKTLYFVPKQDGESGDYYDEYIWARAVEGGQAAHWERIGSTNYVPDHTIADDTDNPGYLVLSIGDDSFAIERTKLITPLLTATYNEEAITSGGNNSANPIVTTGSTAYIEVSCNNVEGAVIYYTLNGTDPTTESSRFAGSMQLYIETGAITPVTGQPSTYTVTFKAKAFANGRGSQVFTYTFYITRKLKQPTISFTEPANDTTTGSVTMAKQTNQGETIQYRTGTSGDPNVNYSTTITGVESNTNYRAWTAKTNWSTSDLSEKLVKFTVKQPTTDISGSNTGNNSSSRTVTIQCHTPLSRIYYTTDGTTPSTNSSYKDMVAGSNTVTLTAFETKGTYNVKALAVKSNWNNSSVGASGEFTVKKISSISFGTPSDDDYETSRTVSVSCATSEVSLSYEVKEGNTVISSGTVVGGSITLAPTGDRTLKVYVTATKTAWTDATGISDDIRVGKTYTHAGMSTRTAADSTTLSQMSIETKADSPTGGAASKRYTFDNSSGSSSVYIWFFIPSTQSIQKIENDLGFNVTDSFDQSSSAVTIDGRSYKWYRSKTTLSAGQSTNYTVK